MPVQNPISLPCRGGLSMRPTEMTALSGGRWKTDRGYSATYGCNLYLLSPSPTQPVQLAIAHFLLVCSENTQEEDGGLKSSAATTTVSLSTLLSSWGKGHCLTSPVASWKVTKGKVLEMERFYFQDFLSVSIWRSNHFLEADL